MCIRDSIYDPANPNKAPYDEAYVTRFRTAQIARNRRITAWVKEELAAIRASDTPNAERAFVVHGTMADVRWTDPTQDPSDRRPYECYLGVPKVANDGPVGLARFSTLRSWLSPQFPRWGRRAVIQVEDFLMATSQLAQTTLRVVLGKHELDEMLAERERLNIDVQKILDAQTDDWGIKVTNVEIKHIDLNETMIRAIARQAEAERERRAKVIHAEGEKQAASALLEAAETLAQRPEAMQLRYLQTMTQVAGDRATTVILPLPLDLIAAMTPKAPPATGGVSVPDS